MINSHDFSYILSCGGSINFCEGSLVIKASEPRLCTDTKLYLCANNIHALRPAMIRSGPYAIGLCLILALDQKLGSSLIPACNPHSISKAGTPKPTT